MIPPLPHARESKGWPARYHIALAADFAGLLARQQFTAFEIVSRALAAFPQKNLLQ